MYMTVLYSPFRSLKALASGFNKCFTPLMISIVLVSKEIFILVNLFDRLAQLSLPECLPLSLLYKPRDPLDGITPLILQQLSVNLCESLLYKVQLRVVCGVYRALWERTRASLLWNLRTTAS